MGVNSWDTIGISTIGDVWRAGNVIPWPELQKEFELRPTEVFRYLQVRQALRAKLTPGTVLLEASPFEMRLFPEHMPKKAISLIYRKWINNSPDLLITLRHKWAQDLGTLEDGEWTEALASPVKWVSGRVSCLYS